LFPELMLAALLDLISAPYPKPPRRFTSDNPSFKVPDSCRASQKRRRMLGGSSASIAVGTQY
jgi:hypothetical protein